MSPFERESIQTRVDSTERKDKRWYQKLTVRLVGLGMMTTSLVLACSSPEPEVKPILKVSSPPAPPESPTPLAILRLPKTPNASPTTDTPFADKQRPTREVLWITQTTVAATSQAIRSPKRN